MAKNKGGRPRVPAGLTDEVKTKIVDAVRKGNYRCAAAQSAGVKESALSKWIAKGAKETSGIYFEFRKAVLEAENLAETDLVGSVVDAAKNGDVRAAQWWLERKFPERWGAGREQVKELKKEVQVLREIVSNAFGPQSQKTG